MSRRKRRGPKPRKEMPMPIAASRNAVLPTPETALKLPDNWFGKLPQDFQRAATALEAGWHLICSGVVARPAKFHRVGGKTLESNVVEARKARLEQAYIAWCGEMGARRLAVKPVIQIIAEGLQPHDVDLASRQPHGWAAERLLEGLALYLRAGWEVA